MKTNFKFFALAAMAAALVFAGCSKDGGETIPDGKKKVTVQMSIGGAKTRAVGSQTAAGQMPSLHQLALLFVGNGTVQQVETIDLSITANQTALENGKAFTVPAAATKVYAVGNHTALTSPTLPAVGASETSVKALALELSLQNNDYQEINLSAGQAGTNGGTAYSGASFAGTVGAETVSLDIVPAFARYEISKVSANPGAEQLLTSFKLTGIFITNTYRTIGLDYETVATVPADIYNFGPGTSGFATAVPALLKDVMTPATAAASFTPTGGTFWHYLVSPPIAGKGTTLQGSTDPESSVPLIVLRIEDVTPDPTNSNTYASVNYVTVRTLKAASGNLSFLRPGYVYQIADIAFGGEHLTTLPAENTEKDVTVTVTFKPWVGEPVTPEL